MVNSSGARQKIRDRALNRTLALAGGELTADVVTEAMELIEDIYISPSTMPKWGGLKTLGFSSWDEVADVNEQEKGVVIK